MEKTHNTINCKTSQNSLIYHEVGYFYNHRVQVQEELTKVALNKQSPELQLCQ